MWSVGVDVSSTSFVACLYSDRGMVTCGRFLLEGDWLSEFERWLNRHEVAVCEAWLVVENTGVYSAPVCYPLYEAGYRIALVSPLQVRDGFRLRKTDEADAARLAEYGYRFADRLQVWCPRSERVERVHQLLVERAHYRDMVQELQSLLRCLQRHPVQSGSTQSRLKQTLLDLERSVERVEEEIRALIAQDERLQEGVSVVRSVPGCGEVLSWWILDLTDGFEREVEGRRLSSYLGTAPHERSSGRSVRQGSHSRGYGPVEVRRVLHMGALAAVRIGGELRDYYRRKVGEGKRGLVVLNGVKNKILHRVCACLRDRRYYEREYDWGQRRSCATTP